MVDGQIVLLCPGSAGGVLEFKKILRDEGCKADIKLGETSSLFYACRSENLVAHIGGIKDNLTLSALPSDDADYIIEFKRCVSWIGKADNVLSTSLSNLNAILHPIPVLLNCMDRSYWGDFRFYYDSITPTIGELIEKVDAERIALGKALGIELKSAMETLKAIMELVVAIYMKL